MKICRVTQHNGDFYIFPGALYPEFVKKHSQSSSIYLPHITITSSSISKIELLDITPLYGTILKGQGRIDHNKIVSQNNKLPEGRINRIIKRKLKESTLFLSQIDGGIETTPGQAKIS